MGGLVGGGGGGGPPPADELLPLADTAVPELSPQPLTTTTSKAAMQSEIATNGNGVGGRQPLDRCDPLLWSAANRGRRVL